MAAVTDVIDLQSMITTSRSKTQIAIFNELIISGIRNKLQMNDHDINYLRFSELKYLYRDIEHHRLTATNKKISGDDFNDSLSNYPQLQTQMLLDNAYTPHDISMVIDQAVTFDPTSPNAWSDPVIINQRLLRTYDSARRQLTLSGFLTAPLTDLNVRKTDTGQRANDDHLSIVATAIFVFEVTLSHVISNSLLDVFKQLDHMNADRYGDNVLKLSDVATLRISPVTSAGVSSLISYQPADQLVKFNQMQTYIKQFADNDLIRRMTRTDTLSLLHVSIRKSRTETQSLLKQFNQQLVDQAKSPWAINIATKLHQLAAPITLDEFDVQTLESALPKLLNGFAISKALDRINGHIMTRQELFSYCMTQPKLKSVKVLSFNQAKGVMQTYLEFQSLQITDMSMLLQYNRKRQAFLANSLKGMQLDNSDILTYDTTQAEYHQPFALHSKLILQTSDRVYGQIWICLTDKRLRWVCPLQIDYSVRRHDRDYVSPIIINDQSRFNTRGILIPSATSDDIPEITESVKLDIINRWITEHLADTIKRVIARMIVDMSNQKITLRTTSDKYHRTFNIFFDN